ncbi:MAG: phosphodiester glycosidase family protein [Patescibacteria group bacterium]
MSRLILDGILMGYSALFRVAFVLVAFLMTGAGCFVSPISVARVQEAVEKVVQTPVRQEEPLLWRDVGQGIGRLELTVSTSTAARMVLYRFPQEGFSWRFAHATSSQRVSAWADQSPRAVLVANGVYFHPDNAPSGMLLSRGKRVGLRQFDLDRTSAMVLAPGKPRIIDTKTESLDIASLTEAAQSYPLLVEQGQARVQEESGKYARRTFFGTDTIGNVYLGVVPDEPVSLFELSQMLLKTQVDWMRVINLDGGPSTGVVLRTSVFDEAIDSYTGVPNVILVEKK